MEQANQGATINPHTGEAFTKEDMGKCPFSSSSTSFKTKTPNIPLWKC